jgi:hypothetical protein
MLCVNDAQYRFKRTYDKIKISGLLDVCDSITVILVGKYKHDYHQYLLNLIQDDKITYLFSDIDTSEVATINLVFEQATKHMYTRKDYNILYLHSKGVTRPHLTSQMVGWADYMEYFLIEEYNKCFQILESYKSCGVLYREGIRMYGGNFWWAKSSLISTLKPLHTNSWRFDCEHWLLNNNVPGFSLCNKFDWAWGFYNKICQRKEYTNIKEIIDEYSMPITLKDKVNIEYAFFGGIDCKEVIVNSIIDNKLYLRADITLVNNVFVEDVDRYLNIKINNEVLRLSNEQYLIYGY